MRLNAVYKNIVRIISGKHQEALSRLKWSSLSQQLTAFMLYLRCIRVFGFISAFYYRLRAFSKININVINVNVLKALNYVLYDSGRLFSYYFISVGVLICSLACDD